MKRMVFAVAVVSLSWLSFVEAEEPKVPSAVTEGLKVPSVTEGQLRAWETHTKRILQKLPFKDRAFLTNVSVTVYAGGEPEVAIRENGGVEIASEFFRVFETDAERLAVLAHEVSHRELKHESAETFNWSGPSFDYVLLERNEIEADWYSLWILKKAGMDICAAKRTLGTLIYGYNMERSPDTPVHHIHFKRLKLLISYCRDKDHLLDFRPESLTDERLQAIGLELK